MKTEKKRVYSLKIAKKIQETDEACSFALEVPEELKRDFTYQPGQFLTLFLKINGKTLKRSYSISSSPLLDEDLTITVKKVHKGQASTFLVEKVKEKEFLSTSRPLGVFFKKPPFFSPEHYVLFSAGSGITPLFSIMKSVLLMNPENTVTLINSNRTEKSIIYNQDIKNWQEKHSERLKIVHCLSQELNLQGLQKKRIHKNLQYKDRLSEDLLNVLLSKESSPLPQSHFYLCGPPSFMLNIKKNLLLQGVSKENIHRETFTSPSLSQKKKQILSKENQNFKNHDHDSTNFKKNHLEIKNSNPKRAKKSLTSSSKDSSPTGPAIDSKSPEPSKKREEETSSSKRDKKEPTKDKAKNEVLSKILKKTLIGEDLKIIETPEKLEVTLDGQNIVIDYNGEEPIVEALIQAGYQPPYSCLEGNCMSCLGHIIKGTVVQDEPGVLEEENIEAKEALTCQAKGLSRFVKVSYDEF